MEAFLKFLNNNWVTSILTGILVTLAFEFAKRLKEKKDYKLQTSLANTEVFNILEACVPEEQLPNPDVVFSFYKSAAKKYKVKIEHMDTLSMIIDDLIKKVMESNFLSYDEKTSHCERLLKLKLDIEKTQEKEIGKDEEGEGEDNETSTLEMISGWISSLLFGLAAAIVMSLSQVESYTMIKNFIESATQVFLSNLIFPLLALMVGGLAIYAKNKR